MKLNKSLLLAIAGVVYAGSANAIPAKQGIRQVIQPDGTTLLVNVIGDENLRFVTDEEGYILARDAEGYYRLAILNEDGLPVPAHMIPSLQFSKEKGIRLSELNIESIMEKRNAARRATQSGMGMYKPGYPTAGSPRCLVILAEFSDVKFSDEYDVKQYFTEMMNGEDFRQFGGTGSVRQYFRDQSDGQFTPVFDVYGPVTLPNTQAYYGGNYGQGWDVFAHYMVSHAATLIDEDVDFRDYDQDGDGDVDFVYIFYAGQGEHNLGGEDTIWPHAGNLKSVGDFKTVDGRWLDLYACSNELEGDRPAGLGPFIHEYSHVLGLPDLYTTDMTVSERDFTPGLYTVLDYGVYNNESRTPPNYTAYERNALGWNEPIMMDEPMSVCLDEISSGEFGLIPTNKSNEFFLLENRQLTGWDSYLPNHGLLVWHIDYNPSVFQSNNVNKRRDHQYVRLVKANNEEGFIKHSEGFPFPGTSGNTSLTSETTPALRSWDGSAIAFPISDIREEGGYALFDIAGGGLSVNVQETPIEPSETVGDVFSVDGCLVMKNVPLQSLQSLLPAGIYIFNGATETKKIAVK